MADIDPRVILDTPMGPNDANATTIRDYLIRLLSDVWEYGEGFDGKRPFGNSGWDWEVLGALAKAGHIHGRFDEDGYVEDMDTQAGHRLIADAIKTLAVPVEDDTATAEVARLRAGEADDPGPADSMPTPAQWIRRWNDATAERRLEVITRILGELDRARRCFEMDHENRLAEAERVARRLADAPTRWAYNQACKALWKHRRRADRYRTAWLSARRRAKEFAQALDEQVDLEAPAVPREGCVDHMPTPNPDCEACTR